jgi:O-antigen/teichoic acid export membrane protein
LTQIVDITQGSVVSKLLRHGSLYFIGNAVASFVNLLLIPLDTRLFSPDEYGIIVTIISITRFMAIFVGLYLDAAYNRFYHEYKHDSYLLRGYISTLYWFVMIWGLAVVVVALTIVGLIVRPGVPVWPTLALAFMAPLFTQLGLMSQAYLQQNHRSGLQVSVLLSNLALNVSVMLITVGVFKVGIAGKFIGIFCGTGLSFLLGTSILAHEGYLRLAFSWHMLIESLRFSLPLLPNIAAGWITGFSDRILLSIYGPVTETGIYNVGYSLGMGITLFSQSVFMVYGPMMYAMMTQDKDVARRRIERFVPYYFMLMLWIFFALSLFAREVVSVLAPAQYQTATSIVPVVLFAYFWGSQYQTSVTILSFMKKIGLISAGAIIQAIINFTLNLLLIPYFGKLAAAWTTVIAVAFYALWMAYWSQRYFPLKINLRRIGLAILSIGTMVTVYLVLAPLVSASILFTVALKLAVLISAVMILWLSGGIESSDKDRIRMQIKV